MDYITFPNGDNVCVIGQGTWNMGRNPLCEKTEAKALLTGIDLGMNMIDTAEMYDNEKFIGKVIKPCRDKVFLVSKVHPDNADYQGTIKAQIALAWIIRNPGVMAIPKASTTEHVKENFGSISIPLDTEDIELLNISFPGPQHKIPLAGW